MPHPLHDENAAIREVKLALGMFSTAQGQAQLHHLGPEQRSAFIHSVVGAALVHRFGRTAVKPEARVRERLNDRAEAGARLDFLLPGLRTAIELELGTTKRLANLLFKAGMDYRVDRLIVICPGRYVVGQNGQGARPVYPRAVPRAEHEREGFDYTSRAFPMQMMRCAQNLGIIQRGVRIVRLDRFEAPHANVEAA